MTDQIHHDGHGRGASAPPDSSAAHRVRATRRGVLLAGAAGAAATLAACTSDAELGLGTPVARALPTTATTVPVAAGATKLGTGEFELFSQTDLNFQTLFAMGSAGRITVAGEVASVVAQANAAQGGATYQNVFDGFVAMGNRLQEKAIASSTAGHLHTARSQYLRSAKYYAQALYWVLGTSTPDAEAKVYSSMDASFRAGIGLMDPRPELIEVSYDGPRPLPVWFFPASSGRGRRPTIIINNGSDGQNVDLLAEGGFGALERGYNVVIFEGPGQGSQLFLHNIAFRHDWEAVITPIVDELVRRRDVDASKIALRGISFGGLLAPRATAFEPRIAALIADPGSTSTWLDYPEVVRNTAKGSREQVNSVWTNAIIPGSTPEQLFSLKKSLEIFSPVAHDEVMAGGAPTDWFELSREIQKYDLAGIAERITAPTLVTMYEGDTAFTDEPRKLHEMLTKARSRELVEFTAVDGAQYHCGPMAPQISNEACWDWLDDQFGR